MAYEIKENSGSIFKHDKKGNDKAPDYKGKINVDGVEKEIALWIRQGSKGSFFSASISEPFKKDNNPLPANLNSESDLPF